MAIPLYSSPEIARLMATDLLLDRLATYWRDDLISSPVEALIATGEPSLLEIVAYRNESVPATLRRKARKLLERLP